MLKELFDFLKSVHPKLLPDIMMLYGNILEHSTYGQLDQYLAVANVFIELYNDEHPDERARIDLGDG